MIRYGFIRTKDEIKFLILTCMTYLPFPVSYDAIVDICTWCDDGFGYFELSEAFSELQDSKHVQKTETDGEEVFSITQKGRETADAFQNRLPYTVREAAELSALRVIRKIRRDAQVFVTTEQKDENLRPNTSQRLCPGDAGAACSSDTDLIFIPLPIEFLHLYFTPHGYNCQ